MFIVDRENKVIVDMDKVQYVNIYKTTENQYSLFFNLDPSECGGIIMGSYSSEEEANCTLAKLIDKLRDYVDNKVWELPTENKTKEQNWKEILENNGR